MTASRTATDRDARTLYVPREAGRRHALGIALNLASAAADSRSGFYTRLIPLDPWTIPFWRFPRGRWDPSIPVAVGVPRRRSFDGPQCADIELPTVLSRGTTTRRVYR